MASGELLEMPQKLGREEELELVCEPSCEPDGDARLLGLQAELERVRSEL